MNSNETLKTPGFSLFNYMMMALFLGALWGFFEVFFKDVLSLGGTPFASATMTGIGVALMAFGYALFKRPGIFATIAVFTIFTRMIIVPILGCSPMCRANAVVALSLLGASTALAFGLASRFRKSNMKYGGLTAGAGVLLSGTLFYPAGLACAPCPYLQAFATGGGFASFMTAEVAGWVLFSAILFYPGYLAGRRLSETLTAWREARPAPYYAALAVGSAVMVLATGLILLP